MKLRKTLVDRARAERDAGNLEAAIELFEEALTGLGAEKVLHSSCKAIEFIELACECGVLCKVNGDLGLARKLYTAAWAVLQARGLTDGVAAATVLHNLGGLMHSLGRPAQAEPFARRAVEIRAEVLGPDHVDTLADRAARAAILIDLGRLDDAESELTVCLQQFRDRGVDDDYDIAAVLHNLATIAVRRGDAQRAVALLDRTIEIKQRIFRHDDPRLVVSRVNLAKVRELIEHTPSAVLDAR